MTAEALQAALEKVASAPADDDIWVELEDLADKLDQPDEVAQAYRTALQSGLGNDDADRVARRAIDFYQAWFMDSPEMLPNLLGEVVSRYPQMEWAFERHVVLLTRAEQWDDLLSLYDDALAATRDETKKRKLLDDAAGLAKDFADSPDRAIGYMEQQLVFEPNNEKLVTNLERLLERQGRWEDMLTLWRRQIPEMGADEARDLRLKVAAVCLNQLARPQEALAELQAIVEQNPGNEEACGYLERILALEDAPLEARTEALGLLKTSYALVERRDDVVRVMQQSLSFAEGDERRRVQRELGNVMAIAGHDADAIMQFAALLEADPTDTDARNQIRQLARRAERYDLQVNALTAAAEASGDATLQVQLWNETARVMRGPLENTDGAIALYRRVLESEGADPQAALSAAHQLTSLLDDGERRAERLDALEKTATLETSAPIRRHVLVQAARLAEELEQAERALSSWDQVLAHDEADAEALAARVKLLEINGMWEPLVQALHLRAAGPVSRQQKRADHMRAAEVLASELGRTEEAIEAWLAVRNEFGEDQILLGALDYLMAGAERWQELAELLHGAVDRDTSTMTGRINRVAGLYHEHLGASTTALALYKQTIELDPNDEAARAGLTALLDDDACVGEATEALMRAFQRTNQVQRSLDLLEPRLRGTDDEAEQADILYKAAQLYIQHGEDAEAAMRALVRAVPLDPTRNEIRQAMLGGASATGSWEDAAQALREAAEVSADEPALAMRLRCAEAEIQESQLGDAASAFAAYLTAHQLVPTDPRVTSSLVRAAARAGEWSHATTAAATLMVTLGRVDEQALLDLESGAAALESWEELAGALEAAVDARGDEIPAHIAKELIGKVSDWYIEQCQDETAATTAARRAVKIAPQDGDALNRLARLLQNAEGPELVNALLRVDAAKEHSLDPLYDAAEAALAWEQDPALTRSVLEKLRQKTARVWTGAVPHEGEKAPPDTMRWCVEKYVPLLLEAGEAEHATRVLLEAAELPFEALESAGLFRRSAELLVERREPLRAIEAYRAALGRTPNDVDNIVRLAQLCETEEERSGAVPLRLRELSLSQDVEHRLELRLAIANRATLQESRGGAVEMLLANLEEHPGHEQSVRGLSTILDNRGRHEQLCEILEAQAQILEEAQDGERAATLWLQAAHLASKRLDDPTRAIASHTRVVNLVEGKESLDALAQLHLKRDEFMDACRWLERRLAVAGEKEQVSMMLKLARTQLRAEQTDAAISTLRGAFAAAPQSAEVRKLLIAQLRQRKNWSVLASTLSTAVDHAADETAVLNYAREAAELYYERLEKPEEAVPVLRRATALAPDDRKLRAMLGEGLREAGELDEAHEVLTSLITLFGRRGSPQRAAAHMELAKVLGAQEKVEEALEQLERASKMDTENLVILRTLAETAQGAGQLDRAERAYRTLLLTIKSQQAGGKELLIGSSEVFVELSRIAGAKGDAAKADELAESALEALGESDTQAAHLQKKLIRLGEQQLALKVIDSRLGYIRSPFRRAEILAYKAGVLADGLGKTEEGFTVRLESIENDPGSPLSHDGMLDLAQQLGKVAEYKATLQGILDKSRRGADAIVRCEVLLSLGGLLATAEQDFDGASAMYEQAEQTGVREVDVLRARARLAGARGDEDEQMRLLQELAERGGAADESRADAYYRMAEVQLASEERLEQGVEALRQAMEEADNVDRACQILRRATEEHPNHGELLDMYGQAARKSGDDKVLLHYLERRTSTPEATPEHAQEAVQKALQLGEGERAEQLMLRAVEIGRDSAAGLYGVAWALLALAERRKDAGDVEGALKWLDEADEFADRETIFEIVKQLAEAALGEDGGADVDLAVRLYERLLEHDSTNRAAWQPLVDIYEQKGDVEAVERVVRETLDGIEELDDRNALRVQFARVLLTTEERTEEAMGVLRDALIDDPVHVEALRLLAEQIEKSGNRQELIDFLRDRVNVAMDRNDHDALRSTSLRLGKLLLEEDAYAASEVYRAAIGFIGDEAELLEALLACLNAETDAGEIASLKERLLAQKEGDDAAALARELAGDFEQLGDAGAVLRVLQVGFTRAPSDTGIRNRLTEIYRQDQRYDLLAEILAAALEGTEDPQKRLEILCECAALQRDHLGNPQGAIPLLEQAREINSTDDRLAVELASTMMAVGEGEQALEVLGEALEAAEESEAQLRLYLTRASVLESNGDVDGSLQDLESAYGLDPEAVTEQLENALDVRSGQAATDGDVETERGCALRLIELLMAREARDEASQRLASWVEYHPDDVDALHMLRDLDAESGQWNLVAATCQRLTELEEGEAQVEAAAMHAYAWAQLGDPAAARGVLEHVWGLQPDDEGIRAEVRKLYEQIGAHRELADMYLYDASVEEDEETKISYLNWASQTLLSLGDTEAAIPALQQTLEIKPDDVNAVCLLSDAYVGMGNPEEAEQILDDALKAVKRKEPLRVMLFHRKARIQGSRGDYDGQLDTLKQGHQADRKNAMVAVELADLAEHMQDWDLATKTLRAITQIDDPACPVTPAQAHVRQGRILLHLGDAKKAQFSLRRATQADPEHPDVLAFQAELDAMG